MNILIIVNHKTKGKGGASVSITNVIAGLKEIKDIKMKTLTQKIQNKLLASLTLDSYLSIPSIVKNILKFKPDIIITQDSIAFPVILISKIMKVPVIHIIRSTVDFCPKYVDIIEYGKACSGINDKKQCFNCIDKWKTLRILIGNRPKGSEHTIRTSLVNMLYKIRYFVCLFNLYLIKKVNINLVASDLMKNYFSKIDWNKFKIINITPIRKQIIEIEYKRKQLVFIRTNFETSHKGLDFIKKLSKSLPKRHYILMIGGNKKEERHPNIVNVGQISSKLLNKLLSDSMITLIPSFCTEAFGRVIPESLVNRTPVISSPQCGANQFFEDIDFLKVVPLKLNLWIKAIEDIISNPPMITNSNISHIYKQFSIEKSKKDFIKIINEVLYKNAC